MSTIALSLVCLLYIARLLIRRLWDCCPLQLVSLSRFSLSWSRCSLYIGIFLVATLGLHALGVQTPNVFLGVLIFFGGLANSQLQSWSSLLETPYVPTQSHTTTTKPSPN
jgi:hypothetical protein